MSAESNVESWVSLNGEILPESQAQIGACSEGVLYGYGVFETLKLKSGELQYASQHFQRLSSGCTGLSVCFSLSENEVLAQSQSLIKRMGWSEGVLRWAVFKNADCSHFLITLKPPRYTEANFKKGFAVTIAAESCAASDGVRQWKHNNYLNNLVTLQQAKQAGFDEALLLNAQGMIAEGCLSNVFWVTDGVLYTPAERCGLLPGVMRAQVMEAARSLGIRVEEVEAPLSVLEECDECFLTNSLVEIMPVRQVCDRKWDIQKSAVTQRLRTTFEA